jgi:glycosyltransferase involved in cell wall biosynthesis
MRERLNLTAETPLIGCVAHLVLVKGHPTLIEAMASLHDTGTHLVLAGRPADPEYAAALRNQVDALGLSERIHFWGEVADIPALHAELDVFVLPTLGRLRMEGCPVAMLEAMACGLPCVVSDIPGPQDVIQNGINGILVPPEDAGALAAALRGLLGAPDLRQAMGEAARERVRAGYTIEGEVQAYQELYMEALGRR